MLGSALELLVKVEHGPLVARARHVACAAAPGAEAWPGVCVSGVNGVGRQLGTVLGGDGVGGAVAGTASAEGHAVHMVEGREGLVERVAGSHGEV